MTEEKKFIKKRRVPRRDFVRNVGILARGKYAISQAFELGEGGMLLTSQIPLLENQQIVIAFRVPGLVHVVVRGTVRYTQKAKMGRPETYGVQFDNLDFDSKRKIRSFVALKTVEATGVTEAV